jgi:hypothetical protein
LAQNNTTVNLTPNGLLDKTFDRFGNSYNLIDLHINTNNHINSVQTAKFNLHFEVGCGMEDPNDMIHLDRRETLLSVLKEIEHFLILPDNFHKVNLWVRNIDNTTTDSNFHLARSSSIYMMPQNENGTIIDGEVWKTLNSGISSYQNILNNPTHFYHGILSFNFDQYLNENVKWHTNLNMLPTSGTKDLYTSALKEIMHLLGVTSLMNAAGKCVFGYEYQYYSRYDTKLVNVDRDQYTNLIMNTPVNNIHRWGFNAQLSPSILRPNCSLVDATNPYTSDQTNCGEEIYYSGSVSFALYTPTCFEIGNSLTCFEDQIFPDCESPYGNNKYFVMSNRLYNGVTKRYPKEEERMVLKDIGYNLSDTFGNSTILDGYYYYTNYQISNSDIIVGVNDGLNTDLTFTFTVEANQNLNLSGSLLLGNDINAASFESLQSINTNATLSTSFGNHTTDIIFNSSQEGIHLLTYLPTNGGFYGSPTNVFIVVYYGNNCGTAAPCSTVVNGGFESFQTIPPFGPHQVNFNCRWQNFSNGGTMGANYFHGLSPNSSYKVPSNIYGFQNDAVVGNQAYVSLGTYFWPNFPNYGHGFQTSNTIGQIIRTTLQQPMIEGRKYLISYQISRVDSGNNNIFYAYQAFVTNLNFPLANINFLTNEHVNQGSLYTNSDQNGNPIFTTDTNQWQNIQFIHASTGEEQYLYIGALNNAPVLNTTNLAGTNAHAVHYIDNVSVTLIDEALPDEFTVPIASTTQLTGASILNNDLFDEAPSQPIITQIPSNHPHINIQANGTLLIAANTPAGIYNLNYFFNNTCGQSNTTTIQVTVGNYVLTHPGKCIPPKICTTPQIQITDTPLSANSSWTEGINPAYLINSNAAQLGDLEFFFVPAPPGWQSWYPVVMPSFLTLNLNGSLTVQPNTPPQAYHILMKACIAGFPDICTQPIRVDGGVGVGIDAQSYNVYVNTSGLPFVDVYPPLSAYSGPMNVLGNATLCGQPASLGSVLIQSSGSSGGWEVDESTGIISNPLGNITVGTFPITYQICQIGGNPSNCATGVITIIVVN